MNHSCTAFTLDLGNGALWELTVPSTVQSHATISCKDFHHTQTECVKLLNCQKEVRGKMSWQYAGKKHVHSPLETCGVFKDTTVKQNSGFQLV